MVCQLDADRLELEAHVEHTRRDAECELCEQEAELEPGTFTPHKHAGPTAAAAWPAGCLLNFEEIAEQAFDQQAELEPGTLTPQRKYHWGPEQQAAADLCAEERPSSCNVQCTRCPSIDAFIVAADGKRLCAECNLVDRLLSGPTAADAVAIAQAHAATGQAPRARARRRESLADLDITSTGFGVLIKPKEPTQ
ncbi:MAG TPA: hypothetical protein VFN67_36395 [Polyangiales bacterium]|nr:hypothetical protein [Polyangiales bacterium]